MDIASLIVGVAVAGASAAQGASVEPVITDTITSVVEEQAPAVSQFIPDPQPYLDQATTALTQLQEQIPPAWQAEAESALPPELKDAAAQIQEILPPQAQALVPDVALPAPGPDSVPPAGSAPDGSAVEDASANDTTPAGGPALLPSVFSAQPSNAAGIPSLTGLFAPSAVPDLKFDPSLPRNVEFARAVIEAAMRALGLPYQWGGGLLTGPSMGDGTGGPIAGYDCSGLSRFAYFIGSGGTKVLPRTSQEQFRAGHQIPMSQAQPGDLLFGNWQADGANHVAIYLGEGKMIEAPQTGQLVQISAVRSDMIPARFL